MKTCIKQFVCITKTQYTKTISIFSAIIQVHNYKKFVLKIKGKCYKDKQLETEHTTYIYFKTLNELTENIMYQYNLCKDNLYTTYIKYTR